MRTPSSEVQENGLAGLVDWFHAARSTNSAAAGCWMHDGRMQMTTGWNARTILPPLLPSDVVLIPPLHTHTAGRQAGRRRSHGPAAIGLRKRQRRRGARACMMHVILCAVRWASYSPSDPRPQTHPFIHSTRRRPRWQRSPPPRPSGSGAGREQPPPHQHQHHQPCPRCRCSWYRGRSTRRPL